MEEIKPRGQTEDLGKAETVNLGQAGNPIKDEVKKEIPPPLPPTDFKVAEIWIKDNQLKLEALPEFWRDKIRALGLLELCKDIVKEAVLPNENRIIKGQDNHKFWNFIRGMGKRKR